MAGSGASVKPIDVTEESMAIELESVALTNIAMCYLKLGEPRQTLEFCKRALATNPTAWKAVLRKSEAQTMMGNYEVSKSTLAEALKLAPDAAAKSAVKKELERVIATDREATQISNIKQKKAFGKMFSSETTPAATSSAASDKLDETVSSESTNT